MKKEYKINPESVMLTMTLEGDAYKAVIDHWEKKRKSIKGYGKGSAVNALLCELWKAKNKNPNEDIKITSKDELIEFLNQKLGTHLA